MEGKDSSFPSLIFMVMAWKGWKKFENSKFWSWATLGGNKVSTAVAVMFSRKLRKQIRQEEWIRDNVPEGMDLDEFFAAYPDKKFEYDSIDGTIKQDIQKTYGDSLDSSDAGWAINKFKSLVDNVTGDRDIAENERNRQFQSQQAELTRQWEAEQAQIAREWDSIGAQMERAAAVGVNPISIAMQNGGINASATSPMPSAPYSPAGSSGLMHGGALDIAQTVFNGIGTFAEQRLKMSQSDDIVAMRQYNIAEKIANTDHLRSLCESVGLSNVAQSIQNRWLDLFNQATYDNMMKDLGYKDAMSEQARSAAKLNLSQIDSVHQSMDLALRRFNATLPLELQLMESEMNRNVMSVQDMVSEIGLRHLQAIEQENRNSISSSEAEIADVQAGIALATYEDAINAFHNDMVRGAAEAGISMQDYIYYNARPGNVWNLPGALGGLINDFHTSRKHKSWFYNPSSDIRGVSLQK